MFIFVNPLTKGGDELGRIAINTDLIVKIKQFQSSNRDISGSEIYFSTGEIMKVQESFETINNFLGTRSK